MEKEKKRNKTKVSYFKILEVKLPPFSLVIKIIFGTIVLSLAILLFTNSLDILNPYIESFVDFIKELTDPGGVV